MQNSRPVGFCYIIDHNKHSYRGFYKEGYREGFGLSDEINGHYLKLNFSKGVANEDI